ncbi:hypothetical protein ACH4Y0_36260 [Streptomyces sp. NPDC020707]|uniref:hypothetical protein n=1 Tax=Streptomyces sp. NPDC020707 TaxID=3365084 RepID=UPI00378BD7C8
MVDASLYAAFLAAALALVVSPGPGPGPGPSMTFIVVMGFFFTGLAVRLLVASPK